MIRPLSIAPLAAACLALASTATASIIHHAPLEDVLGKADWVMVATVERVEVREDNVHKLFTWTVHKERELRSTAPIPDLPLMYSHRWPVMLDERGAVIGTISPIYDGSGLEHDVKAGQTWIFMGHGLTSEGAEVLFVDRVEPLALEDQIAQLLLAQHGSGLVAPAPAATPYSPPKTVPGEDAALPFPPAMGWNPPGWPPATGRQGGPRCACFSPRRPLA